MNYNKLNIIFHLLLLWVTVEDPFAFRISIPDALPVTTLILSCHNVFIMALDGINMYCFMHSVG